MVENRMETRWRLYNASGVRWQRMVVRHADEKPLVSAGNILAFATCSRLVTASAAFPGLPSFRGCTGSELPKYCLCGTSLRSSDTGSPNNATCADLDHCAPRSLCASACLGQKLTEPEPPKPQLGWVLEYVGPGGTLFSQAPVGAI
jgi:hypothetical protein